MRRGGIFALIALGSAACQTLLSFDQPGPQTVFVPVEPEGGARSEGDGGTVRADAGDAATIDGAAADAACGDPSLGIVYCADFNGPRLDSYGPFPSTGGYALAPGGIDGTTRLTIAPAAGPVTLHDFGAGAEKFTWWLEADVGCTTGGATAAGPRAFLGLRTTNGDPMPVLFCTPAGQALDLQAGFLNGDGSYVPAILVASGMPASGALRHIELMFQQQGPNVSLAVLGASGGSAPASAALSSMHLATAISGTAEVTAYVDNVVLRRQ